MAHCGDNPAGRPTPLPAWRTRPRSSSCSRRGAAATAPPTTGCSRSSTPSCTASRAASCGARCPGHSLQPTLLVHEVYMRLAGRRRRAAGPHPLPERGGAGDAPHPGGRGARSAGRRSAAAARCASRSPASWPRRRRDPVDVLTLNTALLRLQDARSAAGRRRRAVVLRRAHPSGDRRAARHLAGHRRPRPAPRARVAETGAHRRATSTAIAALAGW